MVARFVQRAKPWQYGVIGVLFLLCAIICLLLIIGTTAIDTRSDDPMAAAASILRRIVTLNRDRPWVLSYNVAVSRLGLILLVIVAPSLALGKRYLRRRTP
jgi:hypothetical protein